MWELGKVNKCARSTAAACLDLLQFLVERPGLGPVFRTRLLFDGRLQIVEQFGGEGFVLPMESREFVEDVMASLKAGMAEDLSAGDHLVGDAAEALLESDTRSFGQRLA
jgi:hypothetical protein